MRVLTYHGVLPADESEPILLKGSVRVGRFERQMEWLARHARVLPMSEALPTLLARTPRSYRDTVVTFDDGLANNAEIALPILERFEVPATIFVATDHLDPDRLLWFNVLRALALADDSTPGTPSERLQRLREAAVAGETEPADAVAIRYGNTWPPAAPRQRLAHALSGMTIEQLKAVSRSELIEIGAHTQTHPRLPLCTPQRLEAEIIDSRRRLESVTGKQVRFFAYPEGLQSDEVREIVSGAGYDAAFTEHTAREGRGDPYRLPRVGAYDRGLVHFVAKWAGLEGPVKRVKDVARLGRL